MEVEELPTNITSKDYLQVTNYLRANIALKETDALLAIYEYLDFNKNANGQFENIFRYSALYLNRKHLH